MRERFFEKVYIGSLFKSTSTESVNEFRESAHIWDCQNSDTFCVPPKFGFSNQNYVCNFSWTFIFCQNAEKMCDPCWQNMKVKLKLEISFWFEKPNFGRTQMVSLFWQTHMNIVILRHNVTVAKSGFRVYTSI